MQTVHCLGTKRQHTEEGGDREKTVSTDVTQNETLDSQGTTLMWPITNVGLVFPWVVLNSG